MGHASWGEDMIEIYTTEKCTICNIAKVAMQMSDIEFVERKCSLIKGGLPFFNNTINKKTYNGWPSTITKLKEILEID